MTDHVTRRRALELAGTAAAVGLAGCTIDGGQADPGAGGTQQSDHPEDGSHHGDGHGHTHTAVPDGPSTATTVEMRSDDDGYHFAPHVAWIEAGGTVTFVNESGTHTATAYHPHTDRPLRQPEAADAWNSGVLTEAGAEFQRTFEVPGVYDYFCVPHESVGMIGTVIVGDPDPHDQPGLAAPQAGLPERARTVMEVLNERVNEALGHTH